MTIAEFDFHQEVQALREDAAIRPGGWERPPSDWMIRYVGWGTHEWVPKNWARLCIMELFGLMELNRLKDLPSGPSLALIDRLFETVRTNEYETRYGNPVRELGRQLMQEAYGKVAGLVPIESTTETPIAEGGK